MDGLMLEMKREYQEDAKRLYDGENEVELKHKDEDEGKEEGESSGGKLGAGESE